MNRLLLTTIAILLTLVPMARAQDGPAEREGEFDIVEAMRRIEKLMGKAEVSLLKSIASEKAAEESREAAKEIDKLLRGHEQQGKEIVDQINNLIDNLPRSSGGGGQSQQPMPDDQKQNARDKKEKPVGDRDPQNSRQGDPKPQDEKEEGKKKRPDELKEKAEVKPVPDWLPRLPAQVREDILNGNLESVPEKYRALVEAWMKKMSEIDK